MARGVKLKPEEFSVLSEGNDVQVAVHKATKHSSFFQNILGFDYFQFNLREEL